MKKIREPRLATPRKHELVAWMLRDMMSRSPSLTLGQARRVFSYGYTLLRKKATAAKVFSIACGVINDRYSMKGRP